MEDLNRIRFLAANYPGLHGLKLVPLGLFVTLTSLWANLPRRPATDLSFPLSVALGSALLYLVVDRYYARAFGQVQRTEASRRLEWWFQIVGAILALAAFVVDTSLMLRVSTLGILFSALFLADYLRITRFSRDRLLHFYFARERFLLFYLVVAAIMLFLSLLPLIGPPDWWQATGVRNPVHVILAAFGILVTIMGIWLHLFFIRSLPPMREAHRG